MWQPLCWSRSPDSKIQGAHMGGRQDSGGPHFGSMNFAIWDLAINGDFHVSDANYGQ